MFELLSVHGFVHHAGNLAITAKGQPAHSVLGFPNFEGEELEASSVKEKEKLVYSYTKNPGKNDI